MRMLRGKKLIEMGWDIPSPRFARDNIRVMEQRPFDGVMLKLPEEVGAGKIFDVAHWKTTETARRDAELATLAAIEWQRFSDNFIVLYAASSMDWFSDEDWNLVLEQTAYCLRAAKAAGCRGLAWDPEPYGNNPWQYSLQAGRAIHSFAEYRAMVRQRGAAFMGLITQEWPDLTLLTLRLLSDFGDGSHWAGKILFEPDPMVRDQLSQGFLFGLHADFLNGMLERAGPEITIVDGNEDAYYFTSPCDYYRSCHLIQQRALELVEPELQQRYRAQVRVGQALYTDYIFGSYETLGDFPRHLVLQARMLTPEEQARWFEHNVYYALETADTYVWCYSEQMNWWTGHGLPPGIEASIQSARRKYSMREPLGFEVESLLRTAQERALR